MKNCPLCQCRAVHLFRLEHTAVWECIAHDCGLLFADPQLDDKTLALAYAKHYYPSTVDGGSAIYENTPEEILWQVFAKLEAELGPLAQKKLLDFGCGVGGLCRVTKEYGICTTAIEPDANARDEARKIGGLIVYANLAGLREAQPEMKFDIVTMWDVVEHLREPWKELEDLSASLKPDGWLLLSTPNAGSLRALLGRKHWENTVNPTHFYYFKRRSLQFALQRSRFRDVRELKIGIRYPAHTTLRRIVNRGLVACRLQGQLLFTARRQALEAVCAVYSRLASAQAAE
jgi:SAM-dependent methyltransferase